jgi:hypothetical protein
MSLLSKYGVRAQQLDGLPVTAGLVLYLDAGNPNSYPGSGTTWLDLSGNNNHLTLTNPSYSMVNDGVFNLEEGRKFIRTSTVSTASQITLIYVIKTTDTQSLFLSGDTGASGNYYIAAYSPSNKFYTSSTGGSPTYFQDLTQRSNVYDNIRTGAFHFVEFKNVNLSSVWPYFKINDYSSFNFDNGQLAAVLLYERNLTTAESQEIYAYFDPRFDFGFVPVPPIVTNGLIFHVDAASYTGGSTLPDLSGNGNTVTMINSPTYSSNNGGYIQLTTSQHLRTEASRVNVVRPLTAEIWVYMESTNRFSLMHKDSQYSIDIKDTGNSYAYADGSTWSYATYGTRSAAGIGTRNVWKQIVYTKDSSNTVRVYVNGVLQDTRTGFGSSFSNNTNPLWLTGYGGSTSSLPSPGMQGRFAIARMYNRQISDAEVSQNFNATKARFGL